MGYTSFISGQGHYRTKWATHNLIYQSRSKSGATIGQNGLHLIHYTRPSMSRATIGQNGFFATARSKAVPPMFQ